MNRRIHIHKINAMIILFTILLICISCKNIDIEDNIKILDTYEGLKYMPPNFNKLSSEIYYTNQEKINGKYICGINKIYNNKIIDIIDFEDANYLSTKLLGNTNLLMVLVENNSAACFYVFNETGIIDKVYLESYEKILSYNILDDGVIVSYQNDNNGKSQIMFINFINHQKDIIRSADTYSIVSNGSNHCICTDYLFNVYNIKVDNGKIIIKKIDTINHMKNSETDIVILFPKNNNNYGVYLEDEYLYLDLIIK